MKNYPTYTDKHSMYHFQEAMNNSKVFYYDGVLCYCTGVQKDLVEILSVNNHSNKFGTRTLIKLKP